VQAPDIRPQPWLPASVVNSLYVVDFRPIRLQVHHVHGEGTVAACI
jgi:hypothetical protein